MGKWKQTVFYRILVFVFAILVVGLTSWPVAALKEERYIKYSNYQIYLYDPDAQNCIPKPKPGDPDNPDAPIIPLVGSTRAEKIWNYIAGLGISGLSDRPEAIAGILGNMQQESGLNPFAKNGGGCVGLIQWCGKPAFKAFMANKGFDDSYFGKSGADEETVNAAISAELEYLFGNYGPGNASRFISRLGVPTNKSGTMGARAYADLFLVDPEGAIYGKESLEDPGVKSVTNPSYLWQDAEKRRGYAAGFFELYGDGTTPDIPDNPDTPDTPDKPDDDDDTEYCKEDPENPDDPDEPEEPEAGNLRSYIESWVWPDYQKGRTNRKPAYAEYMDSGKTPYHPCDGVDCGAFVSNIIVASGWDTSYPLGPTSTQRSWLASNWNQVSVGSLKMGDVGIKEGHVILYIGNIPGYASNTASASDCNGPNRRAPSVGSSGENLNNYTWYRKK